MNVRAYSIALATVFIAIVGAIVITVLDGYKIPISHVHDDIHVFPLAKNCYPEVAGFIGFNRHAKIPFGKYIDMQKALQDCNAKELSARQMEILTKAAAQTEYDIHLHDHALTQLERASRLGGDALLKRIGKDHYGLDLPRARPTL